MSGLERSVRQTMGWVVDAIGDYQTLGWTGGLSAGDAEVLDALQGVHARCDRVLTCRYGRGLDLPAVDAGPA